MHAFEVAAVKERLREAGGGYEIVHESAGLEVGVYSLVAPEPDRQQPHEDDERPGRVDQDVVAEDDRADERVPI